jgi:hypothetical protein
MILGLGINSIYMFPQIGPNPLSRDANIRVDETVIFKFKNCILRPKTVFLRNKNCISFYFRQKFHLKNCILDLIACILPYLGPQNCTEYRYTVLLGISALVLPKIW